MLIITTEKSTGDSASDEIPIQRVTRVDANGLAVFRMHLAQLDQNDRTLTAAWAVAGARRISKVPASGVVSLLVREDAFDDEDFLSARMLMGWE